MEDSKDLISRQAAIDEVKQLYEWHDTVTEDRLINHLKRLPSAQPERKTGRWIYDGDCYVCSECRSAYGWWAYSQVSNFCQNCGADMREGEERD